jgi:ribosomal protein S18 acetylase RimI-like enzyme
MTIEQFEEFKIRSIASYTIDIHESYGLSKEKALIRSQTETNKLLKEGIETEGFIFLSIMRETQPETMGHLWVKLYPKTKEAFIYHIEIYEAYRGQGFGKQALDQLGTYLKGKGINNLRLNVFKSNTIAKSLYEKTGFNSISTQMMKDL